LAEDNHGWAGRLRGTVLRGGRRDSSRAFPRLLRLVLLLFFGAGVIALLAVGYWRWFEERARLQDSLAAQAGFAAFSSHTSLQDLGRGLALAAKGPRADAPALEKRFRDLLAVCPRLTAVRAYRPDGSLLTEARRGGPGFSARPVPARHPALSPAADPTPSSPGFRIGANRPCGQDGRWCIPIQRLVQPDGRKGALLLEALLPVSHLTRLWRSLKLPEGASVGLLRGDRRHQARWPAPEPSRLYRQEAPGSLASRLQAHPEGDTGHFSGAVYSGGGQRLGAFARLPFLPLTAYVALPREAVWSAWWRRSRPLFLSFGLYLGLLGGLSHLVTRRERYYRGELHSLARVDSLTGLANGLGFSEALAEATARHQRSGGDLALLLLDLDNFKEVNDRFGHGVGDELLQAVARRLAAHMRTGDRLARRSGDEFLVLLNDVDAEGAASSATRILELFAQPFEVAGRTVALTPSIGIATRTGHTGEGDLQQQADSALEAAKGQGGNQYVFFAREMGEAIRRKLDLKQDLVRAWEQGEFRMHFQPLYRLSDHALMGAEALMRWQDPEQGMRSPAEFIPLAEETGLIVPMGRWAMETACAEVRDWRGGLAPLYLSLNVSPRQMGEPDFENQVADVLHRTGLPPERLLLEITESIAMAAEEEGNRLLHRLRERGVRIAVDDFGTGYSSLSYLENLPVDLIKIDRSFVARLDQPETRTIVQVIIDLTDTLGLECLAEGIETADQEEALRRLGCELGQGYRYGRPLPAEAFREGFL